MTTCAESCERSSASVWVPAWLFEPLFSFFFPLPKIALIPLYVHLFGLFSLSKVMLIFTDCLFPIVIFILPVLFVITLVPGMLTVLKDLKILGGG